MSQKWLNNVLEIRKSKKGKIYVSFTEDKELFDAFVSRLKPGAAVSCRKTEDELTEALNADKINQETYERLMANVASWIKYKGHMGPDNK